MAFKLPSSSIFRVAAGMVLAMLPAVSLAAPADGPAAQAQDGSPSSWFVGGPRGEPTPDEYKNVTVNEQLKTRLPLNLEFRDERNAPVKLSQYFSGHKPVVLQLGYFRCPMLCGLITQGFIHSLNEVPLNVGQDFDVVFVSIDPEEGPDLGSAKKQSFVDAYNRPGSAAGWHLLTGQREQIAALAQAVGFEYKWVESAQQFSHPACLIVCTPDGQVSRYLYGVKFDPKTVRLSLVEASAGQVGTTSDRFILTCFQFDGHQGRYALAAVNLMRAGGVVTALCVGATILFLFRRDKKWSGKEQGFGGANSA